MKKLRLPAVMLALCAALAVNAGAAETDEAVTTAEAAETVEAAEAAEAAPTVVSIVFPGKTEIPVTSSDSSHSPEVNSAVFFDHIAETGCTFVSDGVEPDTFSLYTATRIPEIMEQLAVVMSGEEGTAVTVAVYATNDNLLIDWEQLDVTDPMEDGGYHVFGVVNDTRYAFYRIDFSILAGDSFTLSDVSIFKITTDGPELEYERWDVVEAGETPPLVPVEGTETEEEPAEEESAGRKIPAFGLYPFPKVIRQ